MFLLAKGEEIIHNIYNGLTRSEIDGNAAWIYETLKDIEEWKAHKKSFVLTKHEAKLIGIIPSNIPFVTLEHCKECYERLGDAHG